MHEQVLLFGAMMVAAAKLSAHVVERLLKQPVVRGEIVVRIIVGPRLLG